MIIDGNEKERAAMEQFHKGNREEGLRLQEEFAAAFREEYGRNTKTRITAPAKQFAGTTGTAKSAWQSTGRIRNMFRTACGR